MALVLPAALLMSASNASAQRRNHTRADVPVVNQMGAAEDNAPIADYQRKMMRKGNMPGCNCMENDQAADCGCKKMADYKDKHDGKMMDKARWYEKDKADINEDYQEAIEKVNRSTFSDANKKILKQQAAENRDLALKQAKEKNDLRIKHFDGRKGMRDQMMQDKRNRKAVKEVMDID